MLPYKTLTSPFSRVHESTHLCVFLDLIQYVNSERKAQIWKRTQNFLFDKHFLLSIIWRILPQTPSTPSLHCGQVYIVITISTDCLIPQTEHGTLGFAKQDKHVSMSRLIFHCPVSFPHTRWWYWHQCPANETKWSVKTVSLKVDKVMPSSSFHVNLLTSFFKF